MNDGFTQRGSHRPRYRSTPAQPQPKPAEFDTGRWLQTAAAWQAAEPWEAGSAFDSGAFEAAPAPQSGWQQPNLSWSAPEQVAAPGYDEFTAPVADPIDSAALDSRPPRRESRGKTAGSAGRGAARNGSRSAAADAALTVARLPRPERTAEPAGSESGRRPGGAHRLPVPPAALKGRAAVVAMAAGAVVAAGQAGSDLAGAKHSNAEADASLHQQLGQTVSLAGASSVVGTPATEPGASSPSAPQILNAAPVGDLSQFQDILQHGEKFANDLQAAADAKFRPLYAKFAKGTYTSGYGARWGAMHPGVDIAAPIGTPIYAVEDGTVIDAGPADGFGMWVRLKHQDGTVTVYGHVDTTTVSVGDHVMAGDQIATVGNRGFSTGPHCHFEVWLNGTDRIDPQPWLASRGIALGPEQD